MSRNSQFPKKVTVQLSASSRSQTTKRTQVGKLTVKSTQAQNCGKKSDKASENSAYEFGGHHPTPKKENRKCVLKPRCLIMESPAMPQTIQNLKFRNRETNAGLGMATKEEKKEWYRQKQKGAWRLSRRVNQLEKRIKKQQRDRQLNVTHVGHVAPVSILPPVVLVPTDTSPWTVVQQPMPTSFLHMAIVPQMQQYITSYIN